MHVATSMIVLALAACGGKPAPAKPPPPAPVDPATLAKQLDIDMTELAALAHRHRGNCGALSTELRTAVDRMKQHAAEVEKMLADPIKGRELKAALAGYADGAATRTDQIAADLHVTYVSCADDQRAALERVIADIPTY